MTRSSEEACWAAVVARDPEAGFLYGVISTGIYCRPSCPSRRPLRKNVSFHETAIAAELAGFRACKRCRPRESAVRVAEHEIEPVVTMCRQLEESFATPSLGQLAKEVQLSPSHAHRLFAKATGLTPKYYREAVLRARVHSGLRQSATVTQALYALGFSSSGRFYEQVARMLGMSPRVYRAGARGTSIRIAFGQSSLGVVLVGVTARGVCAVSLGDEREALLVELQERFPEATLVRSGARTDEFDRLLARVIEAVEGRADASGTALPLDIRGTVFQEQVWRALLRIPPGKTATYTELAQAVGFPTAVRAVAHACAENRIAVLVPCHRAVRKGGALAGYRWGIERKRALLQRETELAVRRAGRRSGRKR